MDFKGSRLRPSKKPLDYVLAVRQNERKKDWTYGLVVVDIFKDKVFCHIMGWVCDSEMKDRLKSEGQQAPRKIGLAPVYKEGWEYNLIDAISAINNVAVKGWKFLFSI